MRHPTDVIREYQTDDLQDLLSAWESASALAHPFLSSEFNQQERKNIQEIYMPNAETWVYEHQGQVAGFIALVGNEVGGLFVHADHIGKGFGRALMDKARELRDGPLDVEVFEKNSVGRKFYDRYGFLQVEKKLHEPTNQTILRLQLAE
ncbi:MAG: GNAT family N-acetyltransferase [Pirellulaceae bacterium]